MTQKTLSVPDISCEHCEHTITQALTPIDGVNAVQVDIPARTVLVTFDESVVSVDRLKEVLAEEEYPVAAS